MEKRTFLFNSMANKALVVLLIAVYNFNYSTFLIYRKRILVMLSGVSGIGRLAPLSEAMCLIHINVVINGEADVSRC